MGKSVKALPSEYGVFMAFISGLKRWAEELNSMVWCQFINMCVS